MVPGAPSSTLPLLPCSGRGCVSLYHLHRWVAPTSRSGFPHSEVTSESALVPRCYSWRVSPSVVRLPVQGGSAGGEPVYSSHRSRASPRYPEGELPDRRSPPGPQRPPPSTSSTLALAP